MLTHLLLTSSLSVVALHRIGFAILSWVHQLFASSSISCDTQSPYEPSTRHLIQFCRCSGTHKLNIIVCVRVNHRNEINYRFLHKVVLMANFGRLKTNTQTRWMTKYGQTFIKRTIVKWAWSGCSKSVIRQYNLSNHPKILLHRQAVVP